MSKGRILVILSIIFILFFSVPSQVGALQPYIGGYLYPFGIMQTQKVLLMVNYQSIQASQIPNGKWLGGVLSAAGANGFIPSGWIYQNGVALNHDNNVWWAPQSYFGTDPGPSLAPIVVGWSAYVAFYERMDISSRTITYKLYTYRSVWDFVRDNPTIHTWNHGTDDSNFLAGKQQHNGTYFKHFQFGVESNSDINETQWEVLNYKPSFYWGTNWRYYAGRVCWYDSSAITWIGDLAYGIGEKNYEGVNTKYTADDRVCWKYTGSIIGDNSLLWSGEGIVSDVVSRPYQ